MADEQKPAADEDKSINELLQEYAEDVKDKDLDDFLKNSDEEDEDAFESDVDDDADEDDAEKLMAVEPTKKSSGIFSMLLIIVAFMAAGAGAYIYLNKDEGMTAIMGGFMGQDEPMQEASLDTPPTPNSAPTMMPAPTQDVANADGTPQPAPITNEAPSADMPADPLAPLTEGSAPMPEPGADLVAVPSPDTSAPALPSPDVPAPAATDAQAAVNQWMSGGDAGIGDSDIPTTPPAATPLPEKNVEELKAKPPTTKKAAKKEAPKAEPKAEPKVAATKSDAQEAAADIKASDEVASSDVKATAAPKKKTAALSPDDDALPPPYVAIQSKKLGNTAPAMASATTKLSVDTVSPTQAPALTKPAPASNAKMAPIVEGGAVVASDGAKHSASGTGRDVEGKANQNLSDVTSATGETAAMVAKGGGMIELPSRGVPAPVGMMPARTIAAPTPELRTYKLAIQGGKSLPPGTQTTAYAQIPDTTTGTKPAVATSANPTPPAVPVARVEAEEPETQSVSPAAPMVNEPEVVSPHVEAAPSAASPSETSAPAIVRAAQQAESAGRAGDALELYQRALEVDAVYGGGTSIDRGAVYDRIGAIRAGQ